MRIFSIGLMVASALVVLLPGAAQPEDVTLTLGAASDFVVEDDGSAQRLRVDGSTGTVHIGNAEIGSVGGASNQGGIYYHDGSSITQLSPGTAGHVLQTLGAAANPVWAPAPINTTQTFHYGVPGPAFRPFFDNQIHRTSNFGFWSSPGTTSGVVEVIAPVNLPDGATVTALDCYYYDNSGTVSMDVEFVFGRRSWQGNPLSLVTLPATTSGTLNAIQRITETNTGDPAINNQTYQYWLYSSMTRTEGSAFDGNTRSYGCRIEYEVDELTLP
jgi:hypothetical protein